jgi:hypothetical protein
VSRLVAVNAKEGSGYYEAPREEASSSSQMDGCMHDFFLCSKFSRKNLD